MDEHPERSGRWTAMVAISPIRRYWALWLRGYYPTLQWLAERGVLPHPVKSLIKLSMIGFARWSVFDRVPASGDGEGVKRLPTPYLLFETNFDGDSDRYLESFCLALPWGMRGNWWRAYGVPNVRKVSRFVSYVDAHKIPIAYYYSAYPDASTKRIRYARELVGEIAALNRNTVNESAEGFQRQYFDLLTKTQHIRLLGPDPPSKQHTDALTVMTRVEDGHVDALKRELERLRGQPLRLPEGTHFARWAVVDHLRPPPTREVDPTSYLLFSAWFDRPRHEFLFGLYDSLETRAQSIWGHCGLDVGDRPKFERELLAHEVNPGSKFHAYDGVTVDEVYNARGCAERLSRFAIKHQGSDAQALQSAWDLEWR
jgi:hypothetical protein